MIKRTLLISACLSLTMQAFPQGSFRDLIFSAFLDTSQVVGILNVPSQGRGVAGLAFHGDSLYVNVTVNGLTGPITDAHIHEGRPGESGGVVYPLGDLVEGNTIEGVITGVKMGNGDLEKFFNGSYYLNIHTAANPAGEIRGQIMPEHERAFTAMLDHSQAGITSTPVNHVIEAGGTEFSPSDLSIMLGDTVTFRWKDGIHTTTSDATGGPDAWDHPLTSESPEFKLVLTTPGTHTYYCQIHRALGMVGAIHVDAGPRGMGTFNLSPDESELEVNVIFSGLANTLTNAHLHYGAAGVSGPVAVGIMDLRDGNAFQGKLDVGSIPGSFLDSLDMGRVFVLLHTDAYPADEIRGQLVPAKPLAFDTWLNTGNEVTGVDPATPGARGLASVQVNGTTDTLWFSILLDSLSDELTGAHFHLGMENEDGPVVVPLTDFIHGNSITGWLSRDDEMFLGDMGFNEFITDMLKGNIYLNLHTALNPPGEVRGQVSRLSGSGIVYNICSGQVNTEVKGTNEARGTGVVALTRDGMLHYLAATEGLNGHVIAAHFHNAPAGMDSGPVHTLTAEDSVLMGYWKDESLTPELVQAFKTGDMYIMFHTDVNPAGDARGQVLYNRGCEIVPVYVNRETGGTSEPRLYPNPAGSTLYLQLNGEISGDYRVVIRNVLGQDIRHFTVPGTAQTVPISLESMDQGIYLLQVSGTGTGSHVLRFIKN
jgi:plastocyanin